ncbi:MAG TPA: ATP-binding protein [Actinomycetota bacterium]|nr:ATP-binding protein [Actinomycetota bacterium]
MIAHARRRRAASPGGVWQIGDVAQRISSPVLAGRATELARLRSATERAAAGTPVAVVVAGEAGVGKTRLVAELAGQAEAAGMAVLGGGCLDVGDGTLPYAPLAEALRELAADLDPAELDGVLGGARIELSRLVPELVPPASAPGPPPGTSPGRLFELLLGVLHRLAARRPVLLADRAAPPDPARAGRPDRRGPRPPARVAAGRRRPGPLPGQPLLRRGAAGRRP